MLSEFQLELSADKLLNLKHVPHYIHWVRDSYSFFRIPPTGHLSPVPEPPRRARIPGTYYYFLPPQGRPAGRGRRMRPANFSNWSTKPSSPTGRPVRVPVRTLISASSSHPRTNSGQSPTISGNRRVGRSWALHEDITKRGLYGRYEELQVRSSLPQNRRPVYS
jgi:hypothetical protein